MELYKKNNKNFLLSVVMPAYNEAKNINKTVAEHVNYLNVQDYDYEIIIVNDGSIDNTLELANEIASGNKKARVINLKENCGKGYAVRVGFQEAKGDFKLFIDADNATSINHLDKVWAFFDEDYQIIIGSRNPKDVQGASQVVKQAKWKRLFGVAGNFFVQLIAVKGIRDTQCGFKIMTKEAADLIFPKLKCDRWAFDVEILFLALKQRLKIGKIPVIWYNSEYSRVGFKGYFITLKEVVMIKYNFLKRKY